MISSGLMSGVEGTVLSRQPEGRLLIDIWLEPRGLLVQIHYRNVRPLQADVSSGESNESSI